MDDTFTHLFGDGEGQLSEDAKSQLMEAVKVKAEELIQSSELVEERVNLALDAQSKEHAKLLTQIKEHYEAREKTLEEGFDTEVTEKVSKTFAAIEQDRANKLQQIKEHYEKQIAEEIPKQRDILIEGVAKYFDNFLDDKLPENFIEEAAKKDYSHDLLSKIGNLVNFHVNVDDEVREGVLDAKNQITDLQEENLKLKREKILSESTKNLPVAEKKFIMESLGDKPIDYIERNLKYTKVLFEKSQEENAKILKESREVTKSPKATDKNENNPTVLEEGNKAATNTQGNEVSDPAMAVWISALTQNPKGY